MSDSASLVIRPGRSNYAYAAVFLVLAAIVLSLVASRGIHSLGDLIIGSLVVGGLGFLGINGLLGAALPKIVVHREVVEARDRLGRLHRLARAQVGRAARRSLFAPLQAGITRPDALLLIGKDGRCLLRIPESDYDPETLRRLVETLGHNWPDTQKATVRQINKQFPGAYAFDYQTVAIAIVAILAVVLAVVALAVRW